MRTFIAALCLSLIVGCSVNAGAPSADAIQSKRTSEAMGEATRQVGMPAIKNYQELKLAKMIYELRDQENYVCYAYLVNINGDLKFIGKCLGYGLPYSVQYTNPQKVVSGSKELGYNYIGAEHNAIMTVPQPDPNGLFMPDGLSATWLMMLDKEGVARPVYIEPQIMVSPFPLHEETKE